VLIVRYRSPRSEETDIDSRLKLRNSADQTGMLGGGAAADVGSASIAPTAGASLESTRPPSVGLQLVYRRVEDLIPEREGCILNVHLPKLDAEISVSRSLLRAKPLTQAYDSTCYRNP
jgi:hypothetical protein